MSSSSASTLKESTGGASTLSAAHEARRGLFAALSAFVIWGLLPAYLRPLSGVPALQIVANRLVWCCVLVLLWLALRGELSLVRKALSDSGTRARLLVSAACISINWLLYVWGVTHGYVIESSLGYFINPLVNVLLGVLVLRERLRLPQWLAIALAAAGVAYLTWLSGRLPWIALALAASFSLYGLVRKLVAVESLVGLGAETLLIAPFGFAYLGWLSAQGHNALLTEGPLITTLLLASGLVTAVPLALFAFGARRIRYSTVGLLQYAGPTLQLMLGVVLYGEPLPFPRLFGFLLIWAALALYAFDSLRTPPTSEQAAPASPAVAPGPPGEGVI